MKGTNWYRAGLMNALSPWSGAFGSQTASGAFTAGPMIWAAAHTTQFTKAGWSYLPVGTGTGTGAGQLANGGTYVTIADWTSGDLTGAAADYTIVIEKMSSEHVGGTRQLRRFYNSIRDPP
jgi:hypothetical protein